ncbi:universal stress protein [Nocardioides panaciterrulae]|uniref:Nucleotide-binding universal stress UspA family protein n=1 Tax=Nocardioides panaciterrulae TaxID=661492 RepID=A0A7Y9E4X3_9ACTN|nr:universal stress protein [Nocardioides panaciterrulae]NYD41190.1 nucleotide-binding universal stress UspA family protein [Nocardioides panaciterrulae]
MAVRPLSVEPPAQDARAPILVAVDDEAVPALAYAVPAARRAGCGLHLLHVIPPGASPQACDRGERLLQAVAVSASAMAEGLRVTTELAHAAPVTEAILRRATGARQLVLQCRDEREDSTCARLACHAPCPVVLVPRPGAREVASPPPARFEVAPAVPEALP